MILKAIKFAEKKHKGQTRKVSGEPYLTHPIMASYVIVKYKKSKHIEELIVSMILHDTLEDTETTFVELAKNFTPLVASLVHELTNDVNEIKRVGKKEYLLTKMLGISNYALVCKLIDTMVNIDDHPKPEYVNNTYINLIELAKKRKLTKSQISIWDDLMIKVQNIRSKY
jgi:guanosine-3',5'-bis(diphosphate) 3'-pyrophosphohydrolase